MVPLVLEQQWVSTLLKRGSEKGDQFPSQMPVSIVGISMIEISVFDSPYLNDIKAIC